jgi:hypothetical protein
MKTILVLFAAMTLSVLLTTPSHAACWWNGWAMECSPSEYHHRHHWNEWKEREHERDIEDWRRHRHHHDYWNRDYYKY